MYGIHPGAIPFPPTPKTLPYVEGRIPAGFPSPAEDFEVERLSLLEMLPPHPLTTLLWCVSSTSMVEAGIFDGDILVVDRSPWQCPPRPVRSGGMTPLALELGEVLRRHLLT